MNESARNTKRVQEETGRFRPKADTGKPETHILRIIIIYDYRVEMGGTIIPALNYIFSELLTNVRICLSAVERLLPALRHPRPRRAARPAAEAERRGQVLRAILKRQRLRG